MYETGTTRLWTHHFTLELLPLIVHRLFNLTYGSLQLVIHLREGSGGVHGSVHFAGVPGVIHMSLGDGEFTTVARRHRR